MNKELKEAIKEIAGKANEIPMDERNDYLHCIYILAKHGVVDIQRGNWRYRAKGKR